MIRINLAPKRRKVARINKGKQEIIGAVIVFLGVAVLIYTFVHKPMSEKLAVLEGQNREIARENAKRKRGVAELAQLKKDVKDLETKKEVIEEVRQARAVPADLLAELSQILSDGSEGAPVQTGDAPIVSSSKIVKGKPTTTNEEAEKERSYRPDWDPHRVWVSSFKEKGGDFELIGGAPSDSDMTQLALRMEASVYFNDVIPRDGKEAIDKGTGLTYVKFRITGKVVY